MRNILFGTILFLTYLPFLVSAQQGQATPATTPKLVKWYTLDEAIALNKKAPRKIMLDIYTDWCGWCKKMDAVTFENPVIATYLNENYYPVKFNAEVTDSIIFKGKTYSFVGEAGKRGYNELAAELMGGRMSYPTVVFLDEQLNTIQAIPGFRAAPEMDKILKFFGDNHYRTTDYNVFLSNYVSPFNEMTNKPAPKGN